MLSTRLRSTSSWSPFGSFPLLLLGSPLTKRGFPISLPSVTSQTSYEPFRPRLIQGLIKPSRKSSRLDFARARGFASASETNPSAAKMPADARNAHLTRDALFDLWQGRPGHWYHPPVALRGHRHGRHWLTCSGGGSGIGLMIAQTLASNGAKVYITGRTKEKLERAAATFKTASTSGDLIPLPANVAHKEGVRTLLDSFQRRETNLSILVNNAGIASEHHETENDSAEAAKDSLFDAKHNTYDDWNQTYNTNVTSSFFVTTAFLPLFQQASDAHHGWSSTVLNITSITGLAKLAQRHFAYNASKAAVIHLTRMLAAELTDKNDLRVRINSIAPGVFPSEMTTGGSGDDQKSSMPTKDFSHSTVVPAGRPGREEDMAQAVLFAVACQYLNGQTIVVDGGYTLGAGM